MTTHIDEQRPGRGGASPPRHARGRAPRWAELIPPAILLVSVGIMAIVRPNAVRDAFSGTRAILIVAGIVVGWLLLSRLVLPRVLRNDWVRIAVLAALAIAVVLVLVVPSIRDKLVVETFPEAKTPASAPANTEQAPSVEPVLLGRGSLAGIDHDATGTATGYRQPDGSFVVGLEQIDVEPGPDSKLYVVPGSGREEPGDVAVLLDSLKGNQGTQFYPVPAGTDLSVGEWTVLIWCRAFEVPIANATISS